MFKKKHCVLTGKSGYCVGVLFDDESKPAWMMNQNRRVPRNMIITVIKN